MYLEVAPEGQAMPYVVFNHDFVQPKFVQGGYSDIEPDNLTFKVYASSAATAESLAASLKSFYDFRKMTTDSDEYTMVLMRKSSAMWFIRKMKSLGNQDVWLYEIQYSWVVGRNPPGA
jgi:hypothetical protein